MKRIVACLVILALLSGCLTQPSPGTQTAEKYWHLDVHVENIEPREGGTLHGSVAPGGIFGDGLDGVHVVFLNEHKEVVKTVPIGNVTGAQPSHFNTSVPTLPAYMTVKVTRIGAPEPNNGFIQGQYIDANGETEPYIVEEYGEYTFNGSR